MLVQVTAHGVHRGRILVAACLTLLALLPAGSSSPAAGTTPAMPQARSAYLSLAADREVRERTVLLSTRLTLPRPDSVFVEMDGTFAPLSTDAAATVYIEIDGRRVTNESTIDWRGSAVPVRHSFNAVGATRLTAESHTIELVAEPLAGSFTVSASSNLSVLVHPAARVSVARLGRTAGPFDFTTEGTSGPDTPHRRLVTLKADARSSVVALAAGTTQKASHDGDAMLGIYVDGRHPGTSRSFWAINDTCSCAEVQAPLFTQALVRGGRRSKVSLDATEFPWDVRFGSPAEDPASYLVRPTATLVVLGGGLRIFGRGRSRLPGYPDLWGTVWDGYCVGSNVGFDPCPPVSSTILLSEEVFRVPKDHSGVVMFAAKAGTGADERDAGGTLTLWLTIDGVRRGSTGIQELRAPFSVSGRDISSSYLAAGKERLRPGRHVVRVYGRADGSFWHVNLSRYAPLVWFD